MQLIFRYPTMLQLNFFYDATWRLHNMPEQTRRLSEGFCNAGPRRFLYFWELQLCLLTSCINILISLIHHFQQVFATLHCPFICKSTVIEVGIYELQCYSSLLKKVSQWWPENQGWWPRKRLLRHPSSHNSLIPFSFTVWVGEVVTWKTQACFSTGSYTR